ncbi:MAG TPA: family 65 glycosyl hydrolase domain-containing protein [Bacteroidales bacterium]|nr:family 65 glycosyl hydrolase domain-containing protein [Bacteroidales bacterium]
MKKYLKSDEWLIIEEGFDPANQRSSESIFSIGNGFMGQRANFEEFYSGRSLQGSYIGGIYYPDKTKVGWWKNGYPEYFAKVINSPNWIGIDVKIGEERLDLAKCKVEAFTRILNMREGYLFRKMSVVMPSGQRVHVESTRFISMDHREIGAIKYSVLLPDTSATVELTPYIDGDVKNEDANYNEKFWNILESKAGEGEAWLLTQTKKLDFTVGVSMRYALTLDSKPMDVHPAMVELAGLSGNTVVTDLPAGKELTLYKFAAVLSNLNHPADELIVRSRQISEMALQKGFDQLLEDHKKQWARIWSHSDIVIKGDPEAQQGIRFNIFQLNQTYNGKDDRLNIGPKGFTGEKYGGSTYWDTEAYCIPFFVATAPPEVTRKLLLYRYRHLPKAIENARKLGFTGGAALYPMVTMNGEECHNEWEITFEEIHRNGAIAFAIYNYVRHTGDVQYLADYGLEVLIAIARFWAQRATWSQVKKQYVILGVTGPNEYENNINNNWYTNTICKWCLDYTGEVIDQLRSFHPASLKEIFARTDFREEQERKLWNEISANLYFPYDAELNLYLQQEGYLDKEQILASELDPAIRPLNQHWSWDRILRSCFIKQADLLQGIYLFEERYDDDFIRRHFEFYESRTVHESSLSPCVHVVLAARIGDMRKAYELYLRTSRLDLDDYNNEVHEGLHITSMAGTWMAVVEGFGGKRVRDGKLHLFPQIPQQWEEYSFRILFRGSDLLVRVSRKGVSLKVMHAPVNLVLYDQELTLQPGTLAEYPLQFRKPAITANPE